MGNEDRAYSKVQQQEEEKWESNFDDQTKVTHTRRQHNPPSPSRDFSFTVSILSSTKTRAPLSPPDFSPADHIFSNGHLLPLSPRSSTNSLDSLTLRPPLFPPTQDQPQQPRQKSRSSTLFARLRRKCGIRSGEKENRGRRFRWRAVKSYVRPLFVVFRHGRKESNKGCEGFISSSYSGDLKPKWKQRGEMRSAPASMRVSPTNSGFVFPSTNSSSSSLASDSSTMEELQAAIQAAIAHCKNSIVAIEKKKLSSNT